MIINKLQLFHTTLPLPFDNANINKKKIFALFSLFFAYFSQLTSKSNRFLRPKTAI